MNVLIIVIPLMVVGVVIATIPVVLGSVRHNRDMREERLETAESAQEEADFWHRMLGHRRSAEVVTTPRLLSDGEVVRTVARAEDHQTVDGESAWPTPG